MLHMFYWYNNFRISEHPLPIAPAEYWHPSYSTYSETLFSHSTRHPTGHNSRCPVPSIPKWWRVVAGIRPFRIPPRPSQCRRRCWCCPEGIWAKTTISNKSWVGSSFECRVSFKALYLDMSFVCDIIFIRPLNT